MARPLRMEFDDAIYHVTSRGNAREDIFDDGEDRNQTRHTDCPGGTSLRVQPERGCRFSAPALRYGQLVGKQALIQETRPDPRCVLLGSGKRHEERARILLRLSLKAPECGIFEAYENYGVKLQALALVNGHDGD